MARVGERIHQKRLELGLSQRELASEGVSYAYISRIEKGTRNPSVRALRQLAPRLGVSVEWLETGVEPTRFAGFEPAELRLLEQALRTLDKTETRNVLLDELGRERARR
jgi:transcriptional regulator with XRE-family HTH domain